MRVCQEVNTGCYRLEPRHRFVLQDEAAVEQLTERMKSMLGPFVLRRLKSDVASQLTAKQHKVEMVSMTDSQADLYTAAVQQLRAQVAASGQGWTCCNECCSMLSLHMVQSAEVEAAWGSCKYCVISTMSVASTMSDAD